MTETPFKQYRPQLPPLTLFYDGACGLCSGYKRFIERLQGDEIHHQPPVLVWQSTAPEGETTCQLEPVTLTPSPEAMQGALHALEESTGTWLKGPDVFLPLLLRLPWPWWGLGQAGLPIWQSPLGRWAIRPVAWVVYRQIARNRHRFRGPGFLRPRG